jgi:hypothetical protein
VEYDKENNFFAFEKIIKDSSNNEIAVKFILKLSEKLKSLDFINGNDNADILIESLNSLLFKGLLKKAKKNLEKVNVESKDSKPSDDVIAREQNLKGKNPAKFKEDKKLNKVAENLEKKVKKLKKDSNKLAEGEAKKVTEDEKSYENFKKQFVEDEAYGHLKQKLDIAESKELIEYKEISISLRKKLSAVFKKILDDNNLNIPISSPEIVSEKIQLKDNTSLPKYDPNLPPNIK